MQATPVNLDFILKTYPATACRQRGYEEVHLAIWAIGGRKGTTLGRADVSRGHAPDVAQGQRDSRAVSFVQSDLGVFTDPALYLDCPSKRGG